MNKFSISQQQLENTPIRSIGIMAFPNAEILDIAGPMEVFTFANMALLEEELITSPIYHIEILAKDKNPVTTLSGLQILPTICYEKDCTELDTLIIPGGANPEFIANDSKLVDWVCANTPKVRRVASVCNGAHVLAKGGLLEGRKATSHWAYCRDLIQKYPSVKWEPDRIFVRDGPIWSSGGITSGIDLALAMLEEDWGHKLALYIAQFLVVFLKRSGGQSQYSAYLTAEAANRHDIRELQTWILENPCADLRVETLAERVAMSPRNFARTFHLETGITPAKYVEMVRIDLVRHYLGNKELQISEIAHKSGFKDIETMRRTFTRHFGINPSEYRSRFGCD